MTTYDDFNTSDVGVHEFLLPRHSDNDPVPYALEIRESIDSMHETKATFTVGEITEHTGWYSGTSQKNLVRITGAWPTPDFYIGGSGSQRWVNPGYANAKKYPAISAECECGTQLQSTKDTAKPTHLKRDINHADDCLPQWRLRARARLFESRKEFGLRYLRLGFTARQISPMIGISPDDTRWYRKLGIEIKRERARARQRSANTAAALVDRYAPSEIAKIYGMGVSTIQNWVRNMTDTDLTDAYHRRKQFQSRESSSRTGVGVSPDEAFTDGGTEGR